MSNWSDPPTSENLRERALTERESFLPDVRVAPELPGDPAELSKPSGEGHGRSRSVNALSDERFAEIIDALCEWKELGVVEQMREDADWWVYASADLAAEVVNLNARLKQAHALTELVP